MITEDRSKNMGLVGAGSETSEEADAGDLVNVLLRDNTADVVAEVLPSIIEIRKLYKKEFARLHPDPTWRLNRVAGIVAKEDEDSFETQFFFIDPSILDQIAEEDYDYYSLSAAINRNDQPFIWLAKCRKSSKDKWYLSMARAQKHAMDSWVRVDASPSRGEYVTGFGEATKEPVWPKDLTWKGMLAEVTERNVISNLNHSVLRRLRGRF